MLAGFLVAETDGSGSIYELVSLLPIVSAATKLPGRDVVYVVRGSILAMIGFILTGEHLSASITRVKEFQDAVVVVYFTMTGWLPVTAARQCVTARPNPYLLRPHPPIFLPLLMGFAALYPSEAIRT